MEKYYKKFNLETTASIEEVKEKYNQLIEEFNPENQDDDLKDFFSAEQSKIKEAYRKILENIIVSNKESNKNDMTSSDIVEENNEIEKTDNKFVKTKSYSWWKYDNEYISGWQYWGRTLVSLLLCIILVGFYLSSVTAYKRAKSLGGSKSSCTFFSIWGALSLFLSYIPGINLINVILHWYLWFSNGPGYIEEN